MYEHFEWFLNKERVDEAGQEMYDLMARLYPITRSITGNGVRETLKIIQEYIPLNIHEVPTGTQVFDWEVPNEWNVEDAYIKDSRGVRVVDFQKSNLHVLNYSVPIHAKMTLDELKNHLFTLPDYPEWTPYLTSYYRKDWGFCLPHNLLQSLPDDLYEVKIESTLKPGFVTWGELYLPGETEEEILLSCYVCHPSMCNDSLSGVVLLTLIGQLLTHLKRRHSFRLLFIPETIGAITWLHENQDKVGRIKCGLVATCLGDPGQSTYKRTKHGNHYLDKVVEKVLEDSGEPFQIIDFFPMGSDERQFSSPGFNLPVGSLMRTPYGRFPQYHSSADNLDFVGSSYLANTYQKYLQVLHVLESDDRYLNLNPKCEPQLGKRGLYSSVGGQKNAQDIQFAMLWVLNFSDGQNSLLDIARRSGMPYELIVRAAKDLQGSELLVSVMQTDERLYARRTR
ncbi:DUF4910 domain-containing protein [Paenibacillus sp. MAH-36]|uniref:DUF4910 domain-containing protein n=1 Tax=Paenibacillus violae TaxID=3077234 RepID=A0ABU3RLH7_9BACL|nr:DUF4910 domain-containing protein [Paenibacillus sp. PFR10]MDU0205144.1 DUF4910 domain-containing protein [Paenibacillus sp. PFR10]